MGRPLFSITYSSPAVREEPEPCVTPYEKWSYWNAFDPDSDEFNENPIIERFIDPLQAQENEEPAIVVDVLRMEGSDSSASSDSSDSERGSPMAVGVDDPARMLADTYSSVDWEERARNSSDMMEEAVSQYAAMFMANHATEREGIRASRQRSATISILPDPRAVSARSPRSMITSNAIETLPRTSNITPINVPIRRPPTEWTHSPPYTPLVPTTPSSRTTYSAVTPSPAPTLTPTLISWPSLPIAPSSPPPNANGPLTNPSARLSLAHLGPIIRVRD